MHKQICLTISALRGQKLRLPKNRTIYLLLSQFVASHLSFGVSTPHLRASHVIARDAPKRVKHV